MMSKQRNRYAAYLCILRINNFQTLIFFQKLAYKYAKSVFIHSVVLKCERIDFIVFTFSVGLFLHFL